MGPLMSPAERSAWIEVYLRAGWCLVRLRPGSKIPAKPAWNEPEQLVRTCPQARDAFRDPRVGIGAHLGASGLCSVDLDALDAAQVALGAVGVDANDVIKAGWQIVSGKPNKARAMFRVPEGVPLTLRQLRIPLPEAEWHKGAPRLGVVLELRCGEVQDVLPPSIHPDTKRPYVAGAIPSPFPELPAEVLDLWRRWDERLPLMLTALGVRSALHGLCSTHDTGKHLRHASPARAEYNRTHEVADLLESHGYTQHGKRWAHAGATGGPGIRQIPGKDDLWQSDNFGDPLCGTFDAWTAHVILDHAANVESAYAEWLESSSERARTSFREVSSSGVNASVAGHSLAGGRESSALYRRIADFKPREWTRLRETSEPDFYVDGLILSRVAGGIVSKGGLGKTTLLMSLGIATAVGGQWLGMKVKKGTFVLLSLDDPQEDLDAAFAGVLRDEHPFADEKTLQAIAERVLLISLRDLPEDISFATTDPYHPGAWRASAVEKIVIEALRRLEDIRCVVFDTARQYAGGTTNDDRVMTVMTKAVTRVADELRCACIIPHHMTKEGARSGSVDQYSGSGSGVFGDNLRLLLNLAPATVEEIASAHHLSDSDRQELSSQQLLKLVDTRGSLVRRALPDIFIARQGSHFQSIDANPKSAKERSAEEMRKVLRAVAAGATSINAIRDKLGGRKTVSAELVRNALAHQLLQRDGGAKGSLRLTAEGASVLARSKGSAGDHAA